MKESDSLNFRRNEMEIIFEYRKNMGIRKPDFAEAGLSEIGSMMDWGSPSSIPKKFRNAPRPSHARTKSSNMLEESKVHGLMMQQFTLKNKVDPKNSKLERMKRCESGLNSQREKTKNWAQLLDFKSPDVRQTREYFQSNQVDQMLKKTDNLKIELSPDTPRQMTSEITPYESQVNLVNSRSPMT